MRLSARRPWMAAALLAGLAAWAGGARAPALAADVEIDRIEFSGVTILDQGEVESSLELTAGDQLERSKVLRSAENLQSLYHLKGYEQVNVRGELARARDDKGTIETVLRFVVKEGSPTRIAEIQLNPATQLDKDFESYWRKIQPDLGAKTGLSAGDILDQEKLSNAKRALQDALASEEFIGASVSEVRIETVPAPAPGVSSEKAARWVRVSFEMDLGDRVTFGFRRNTVFTRGALLGFVEEQRLLGFGKDYVGAIKTRIEDEYRQAGYPRIAVAAYTFEKPGGQGRHVTYEIQEGPKVPIASVDFEGNRVFTSDQLREEFFSQASYMIQRRIYVDKEVEKAAELLIEWMKSQGYLASKLVTINRAYSEKEKAMHLTIYLYEGDQTVVQNISVEGAKAIAVEEIARILNVQSGAPLNLFAFNEGLEGLKAAYRARGYLEMSIVNEGQDSVIQYSRENRYADVSLEIAEGPQFRVSRIEIEGLSVTRESVVRRELQFKEGDILEEPAVLESESRLRKLALFSSVAIRAIDDPNEKAAKVVRVSVQEGTPGVWAVGGGYRNDLGARGFGQLAYTNVWHLNHTVLFNATANNRSFGGGRDFCADRKTNQPGQCFFEYQALLGYVMPYFPGLGETTFRPYFSIERTLYLNFERAAATAAAIWERPLLTNPNLVGTFTYSIERLQQSNARDTVDEGLFTIGSITPALRLDLRDNALAPTKGFFASSSFEIASPSFGSQTDPVPVGYTRFQARTDYYIPIARDTTWFLSFRTGIERNTESPPASNPDDPRYAIPLSKLFTLGGVGSIRGFREQEINVTDSFNDVAIRNMLSYVNYRSQVDFPFAGPMRLGVFLDAGNLAVDRYSLGNLRYGTGLGLHYQSPVGPVNFDWGFKLDRRPGEEANLFYFSIGVI